MLGSSFLPNSSVHSGPAKSQMPTRPPRRGSHSHSLDEYVHAALRAGAAGFLLKSVEAPRLIEAVKLVAAGEGVPAPQVTRKLITEFAQSAGKLVTALSGLDDLTDREREVLGCLGAGLSNAEIGTRLHIGETTVKTHVSRVLTKLDLRSRVQAAILAQEAGLALN